MGLAAAAAVLASLAAAPAAQATSAFGMNVGTVMSSPDLASRRDALLSKLAATGTTSVRTDAFWGWNEPGAPRVVTTTTGGVLGIGQKTTKTTVHDFEWGTTDALMDQFAAHGLRWEPVLTYTPTWAQTILGDTHSRPRNIADFAHWAGAFAARYGSRGTRRGTYGVHRYEIWNEPNIRTFFKPDPDPAYYSRLYLATARAIRAADPTAVLVTGGLAGYADRGFLRATVAANPVIRGRRTVDEVAIHPYGRSAVGVIDRTRELRRALVGIGLPGRPLAINEVGWRTRHRQRDRGALPETTRAGNLALLTDALSQSDCGVSNIEPYTWATEERDPRAFGQWWGIVHPNGTYRPTATAYVAALHRAAVTRRYPLPVCSRRSTARPLRLGLKVIGHKPGCRLYLTSYAGYPVNGITVTGRAAHHQRVTGATNTAGRVRLCARRRGAFRVRAVAENWARSSWLRR